MHPARRRIVFAHHRAVLIWLARDRDAPKNRLEIGALRGQPDQQPQGDRGAELDAESKPRRVNKEMRPTIVWGFVFCRGSRIPRPLARLQQVRDRRQPTNEFQKVQALKRSRFIAGWQSLYAQSIQMPNHQAQVGDPLG